MWQRTVSRRWLETPRGLDRPLHVLVESGHPGAAIADFSALRLAGLDVAVCSGPDGRGEECPLVRGEPCRYAAHADAVLVELDLSQVASRRVVDALSACYPDTPIVVEVRRRERSDESNLPVGVVRLPAPSSVGEQVRVLRQAALDGRRAHAHRDGRP